MSLFKALNNVFGTRNLSSHHQQQHQSSSSAAASDRSIGTHSGRANGLLNIQTSWQAIRNSLTSPNQRHSNLQSTSIKNHLDILWECLAIESNVPLNTSHSKPSLATHTDDVGECVEYFLQSNIPANLVSLSLPDQPIGVKGLVINFFLSLVVFLDEKFVINPKVYKPLVRLLRSCVEPELDIDDGDDGGWRTKEDAYEEAVVELMCHLCSRIKTYPQLLMVFLQTRSRLLQPQSNSQDFASDTSLGSRSPTPVPVTNQPSQRKFVHFSPELRHSPSNSIVSAVETAIGTSSHSPPESSASPSKNSMTSKSRTNLYPLSDSVSNALRGDSDMLIFSYLLRFIHREGRTGDLARAGLLFLMELAMGRRQLSANSRSKSLNSADQLEADLFEAADSISMAFGEWVLDSDFADVLGAGLGAAYGLLPSKLVITPRDPNNGDEHGGMVLGGMGTHLSEDQAQNEHTQEEREREQRRERLLIGLGVSGSEDFRAQMNLFLKLIEFSQDVLRNTSPSTLDHYASITEPSSETTNFPSALYPGPLSPTNNKFDSFVENANLTPNPTPAEIISSAISSSVLASIRKLFMNAIIYPSLLECSDFDGSAVAVMSYLEAILSILETDSEIADSFLRFLMAEDEEELELGDTRFKSQDHGRYGPQGDIIYLESSGKTKRRRRRSGVMQIIQADFQQAKPGGSAISSKTGLLYFNSFGRFTLKDLLVNNVSSLDSRTATAALKLLSIILVKHDRYALPLLDIIPDPKATAFPFPHQVEDDVELFPQDSRSGSIISGTVGHIDAKASDEENEEFVYPLPKSSIKLEYNAEDEDEFHYPGDNPPTAVVWNRLGEEEDGEEFTYPNPSNKLKNSEKIRASSDHSQNRGQLTPHSSRASFASLSWMRKSPCPTYRSHRAGLDHLASLIELIEPTKSVLKAESTQGYLSTAFGHYLLDAEAELTGTATFRRGLLLDHVSASILPSPGHPRSKIEFLSPNPGAPPKKSDLELIDDPVIRHRLPADAALLSGLLQSLAKFFVQPPELNLVLTGCVATLASCPTRSLDGWMVPFILEIGETEDGQEDENESYVRRLSISRAPYDQAMDDFDEGDDRSIDFAVEEYSISTHESVVKLENESTRSLNAKKNNGGSILEVYRQLAEQVAGYRTSITGFDRYLKERRQGLIFVENLEDALDTLPSALVGAEKKEEFKVASKTIQEEVFENQKKSIEPIRRPNKTRDVSSFFTSLFKPGDKSSLSLSTQSVSNSNSTNRTSTRDERPMTPDRTVQTFRPFSDHYQQTGSIKLTVMPVETPASAKKNKAFYDTDLSLQNRSYDDDEDEDGPETPTRKTKGGVRLIDESEIKSNGLGQRLVMGSGSETRRDENRLNSSSFPSSSSSSSSSLRTTKSTKGMSNLSEKKISLSMLLDNVVVLEEAIKELGAILSARKSLGIDPVRFL
ncbi:Retinoic acid induced 16-like protein-domain-containing protein [Phakopsora pachyrhizi]|uniref:Retinoic acid induced 16-like protein-domain-containing protein n=1 Tax=Phakopsora pachyrhizi TaxID=170000 RepID=A0AAV0AHU2_PHAPC|nr:Retinoic acid induced 16-like protein-domain-containing protein [Phakopsora pachyrhizi]